MEHSPSIWTIRGHSYELWQQTWLMGIVNVTPDSFSDGGQFFDPAKAAAHALQLDQQGAHILDLGGESTRPGAEPVSLDEELDRILPVLKLLAGKTQALISIDTTKSEVARQALELGADIINDISGLTFDPQMPKVCQHYQAGIVCMHIQNTPQTMQLNPVYEDCLNDVKAWLRSRLDSLISAGISPDSIILDPGIGFGKTAAHNLQLLSNIASLCELNRPILIGHSRKRFLKKILGEDLDEALYGTLGVSLALAHQGAHILRVHDVQATRETLTAFNTILAH